MEKKVNKFCFCLFWCLVQHFLEGWGGTGGFVFPTTALECVRQSNSRVLLLPSLCTLITNSSLKDAVISSAVPQLHYSPTTLSPLKDESFGYKDISKVLVRHMTHRCYTCPSD